MTKIVKKIKIKNSLGLHTRPATIIVKLLQNYQSHILFKYKKETINARSIMGILMLAAKKNSNILVTVEGSDAEALLDELNKVFEDRFGEV